MTRLVANVPLNMYDFITQSSLMEFFEFGEVTTQTSTRFVITETFNGGTETLSLIGTFGGYTDEGIPTTGTVTGGSFIVNGVTLFTFSGASVPVSDGGNLSFTWFVESDDMLGLFKFLLRSSDEIIGSNEHDQLYGFEGNDILDGRGGDDYLWGGNGNDHYYVDSSGDRPLEFAGGGTDTVFATASSFTLASGQHGDLENLTYTGTGNFSGVGNHLNNVLRGGSGNDMLNGSLGADTMYGGDGDDTYMVDNVGDVVVETATGGTNDIVQSTISYTLGAGQDNLILLSPANISGTGNELDNRITGTAGSNILDGGAGADTLMGGAGDDHYIVDNAGDRIIEGTNAGVDIVESYVTYALTAGDAVNVENLTLAGTDSINATGNALANSIVGNAGSNIINGGLGADTMVGNFGNDTYFVDNSADQVIETFIDGGIDTVYSIAGTYALLNNEFGYVENLTYTGTGSFTGTGNFLANTIRGGSGNDRLDGGSGVDRLYGGDGNDIYYVDHTSDRAYEVSATGGIDIVMSSVNFVLGANVERLVLTGSVGLRGYGNELANVLTGNDGNNILDGKAGADIMAGGLGNDIYYVDHTSDRAIEAASAGIDVVYSSVNHVLGANVERLYLTGNLGTRGYGNELSNIITGNAGNNIIDGKGGADRMTGGAGNDIYYVDSTGDRTIEEAGGGTDVVYASITHTLAANMERVILTGTGNVHATGNGIANIITGNAGANRLSGLEGADTLSGGAGNDQLFGGAGNDRLYGGAGADKFFFDTALSSSTNVDRIMDYNVADDTIILDQAVFAAFANLGYVAADSFVLGNRAQDANDYILYDSSNGRIYYDADGNGAGAAVLFATVTAGTALTASDFYVVG